MQIICAEDVKNKSNNFIFLINLHDQVEQPEFIAPTLKLSFLYLFMY